jgi:hypothetical protein
MLLTLRTRKRLLLGGATLVLIGVVVIAVTFAVQTAKINRASILLTRLQEAPLGDLSRTEVEQLEKKYGSGKRSCSASACEYLFDFDNAPLRRLGLARLTRLSVFIGTDAERARYFEADFGTSVPISDMPGTISLEGEFPVSVHAVQFKCELPCNPKDGPSDVRTRRTPAWVPMMVNTKLPPGASPGQRWEALAFNLECLRTFGGCRNAWEMLLPQAWPALDRAEESGWHPQ